MLPAPVRTQAGAWAATQVHAGPHDETDLMLDRRGLRRVWIIGFVLMFLTIATWSLAMPLSAAPDEPAHYTKAAARRWPSVAGSHRLAAILGLVLVGTRWRDLWALLARRAVRAALLVVVAAAAVAQVYIRVAHTITLIAGPPVTLTDAAIWRVSAGHSGLWSHQMIAQLGWQTPTHCSRSCECGWRSWRRPWRRQCCRSWPRRRPLVSPDSSGRVATCCRSPSAFPCSPGSRWRDIPVTALTPAGWRGRSRVWSASARWPPSMRRCAAIWSALTGRSTR